MIKRSLQHPLVRILTMLLILPWASAAAVHAQSGTEFQGTVLAVEATGGKLTVKKDEGGTRFTFVVNDKTQFSGDGPKSLSDVKKGDHVVVRYRVDGAQYLAQTVVAVGKK